MNVQGKPTRFAITTPWHDCDVELASCFIGGHELFAHDPEKSWID